MNIKLEKACVFGKLNAIPSKSYAHRISICNFLAGGSPKSGCENFTSKDIEATERCLSVLSSGGSSLDCGESGSTLRFLIPLCAALGGEYRLIGHGRLMQRPNEELFAVLREHGITAEQSDCVRVSGKLTAGEYRIKGDISSQYVTGLLMALPILDGDSTIVLTTPLVSAPYVDITLEILSAFGVEITKQENGYFIKGNQKYSGSALPEGDWSNVAFLLALGAISGDITVNGLNLNSVQGDKKILEVLKSAGAKLTVKENSVRVEKSQLKAFTLDAEDCPDLVPITAVIAAYADGRTQINNVERLKIKESDRIESTLKMLKSFGINAESDGHTLWVDGGKPVGGKEDSFNDHRIAMALAVLASGADGQSVITNAQAVNKSYPTFFDDFRAVGGNASEF